MKLGIRRRLQIELGRQAPNGEPYLIIAQVRNNGLTEWTAMLPVPSIRQFAGLADLAASVATASARHVVEDKVREALRQTLARMVTGTP